MLRFASDLPNALVRFFPAGTDSIHEVDKKLPVVVRRGSATQLPRPGEVDQIPVYVELSLSVRRVTHPHGFGLPVAFEVIEMYFIEARFASHPVHQLQFSGASRRTAFYEAAKPLGLRFAAEICESLYREHAVPHPAVAVVPVTLPAHCLRQRSGWGGHEGTGWSVRQCLQDDGRTNLRIRRLTVDLVRPSLPPRYGLLDSLLEFLAVCHVTRVLVDRLRSGKFDRQDVALSLIHSQHAGEVVIRSDDERQRPRDNQPRVAVSYTHLRAHETVLDLVCRLL